MKKFVVGGALLSMMSLACAQAYVGGAVGYAQLEVDCGTLPQCDKSGTGAKIYGGYKINPAIAIEAGFIDYGKAKASSTYYQSELKVSAFHVAAALRGELGRRFALVGRLGLAVVDSKLSYYRPFARSGDSNSESNVKPYLGLGAEFLVTGGLKVTAGADFTQGELDGNSGAVRLFSLGLQYDF